MTKQNTSSNKAHEQALTAEDILGREVIDPSGDIVGIADQLYFDRKDYHLISISVDRGLLRSGLIIGAELIKRISKHAILLDQQPLHQLKGKKVYDESGGLVGTIKEVVLKDSGHDMEALIVKKKSQELIILPEQIKRIGKGLFLKVKEEDLQASQS